MKWYVRIFVLCVFLMGGAAMSQAVVKDQPVKKLYTAKEKAKIKENFYKNIKTLKMTPEVEKSYLGVVNKYSLRLNEANRNMDLNNEQYERVITSLIKEQNSKVKKVLTYDQYKKHLILFNPIENSIKHRINKR